MEVALKNVQKSGSLEDNIKAGSLHYLVDVDVSISIF